MQLFIIKTAQVFRTFFRDKEYLPQGCVSYRDPLAVKDVFDIIKGAFITADMQKIVAFGYEAKQIIFPEQLCALRW